METIQNGMTLKRIGVILTLLAVFFLFGWLIGRHSGRNSVRTEEMRPVSGVVEAEEVAKSMTEKKPDTIFVPVPIYIREDSHDQIAYTSETQPVVPEVVPIEDTAPGTERNAAINVALIDWNTKRSYKGTLFDDKTVGTVTYAFDVQFNRAGQINYRFEPTPIPKPQRRFHPTVGGEYYSNGQYGFGAGVQYGAFGVSARALKLPKASSEDGFAFGIGVQIIF